MKFRYIDSIRRKVIALLFHQGSWIFQTGHEKDTHAMPVIASCGTKRLRGSYRNLQVPIIKQSLRAIVTGVELIVMDINLHDKNFF